MIQVTIHDETLRHAATAGMDEFVQVFVDSIMNAVGGELTAEAMAELNSDQITLIAYSMLREEVMDGGFVQLIHNGLGKFIFFNPFAKALALWGLTDLARLIRKGHKYYKKYHEEIEVECTDEEFMAMFERMPEFDDLDDEFVANEEEWTGEIARFIDNNIEKFASIDGKEG
ncbi:MAG: DMP19 family protein [Bacteroidales bacterium]|nr:DMP19 family protein [Bacteroidales bacterium]MCM1148262.1 DMP19 family protein [Bacteroidales bacterium]MCM1206585.1 DMP19 family protein [Bacillota bacterium]MCM1510513.1 DMP19 family protein [Clostridium sp.]